MSRRTFVAMSGLSPLALAAGKKIPIGLELFSVRDALMKDRTTTVSAVAKMGYEVVEFYAPYFDWTTANAKDVRKQLDDLGIRCNSTHNNPASFTAEGLPKAIELNQI
ncbi:MAG TPA: sugar phosphate isomerase/epimerase, partial [Bryobacteraceae bacterium]